MLKDNKAQAFVSAGNTGALFGAAFLKLGLMEGIERPAICAILDITETSPVLLLDAGANADCKPNTCCSLRKWAVTSPSRVIGLEEPRIGLLSKGSEETKGNRLMIDSYEMLKDANLNFIGNIEANDIAYTGKPTWW